MGRAANRYTTEDAINDYRLWKSGHQMAEEFYRTAPAPRPGSVFDYDYTSHSNALRRLHRMSPMDSVGAVLLLEAVIFEMNDEGSGVSTKGLQSLQTMFASRISRGHLGAINLAHLMAKQKAIQSFL